MEAELDKLNEIEDEQKKANKNLDQCLSQIKGLGDQFKNEISYKKFAYVTKQDLIKGLDLGDDHLLIQAPQGTEIKFSIDK